MSDFRTVGFIGLGAMGLPMAEQLATKLPAESRLCVYDVNAAAMDDLARRCSSLGRGVDTGESPRDVASQSDVIISMVPEGAHVRAVYLDEATGVCATDLAGRLIVDCSTIDTATSIAVREHIQQLQQQQQQQQQQRKAASFYDAPVSGGVLGAQRGTIAFFLGCAETDPNFAALSRLLALMGKQVVACGGPSRGLTAKLCNNYLSGLIAIASVDAMKLAMANGLDPRVFNRVLAAGTAQNTICDQFNPVPGVVADAPASNGYRNGFKVQLMRKDFGLAVDMARRSGVDLVLGDAGLATYEGAANDPRCRDLDSRVVFRYLGGDEDWASRWPESA